MTTTSTKSVVVVDDSPSLIALFRRGVDGLNVDLQVFSNSSEAWSYLQSNKPDLLFLNIKMPGKDGLAMLSALRELPLHRETAVVMISSKDYAQDRAVAFGLGAVDFITKPMPIQAIKDAIVRHLEF